MHLTVTTSGSKLWRRACRFDGKEKLLALGVYPEVALKDARAKRDQARAFLPSGVDPEAKRKLEKLTKEITNAQTFKALAEECQDKLKRDGRAPATLVKNEWLFALAMPKLGERPIADITAAEIQPLDALHGFQAGGRVHPWLPRDRLTPPERMRRDFRRQIMGKPDLKKAKLSVPDGHRKTDLRCG